MYDGPPAPPPLEEIRAALSASRGERRSPALYMSLPQCLEEFGLWLSDSRKHDPLQDDSWMSAVKDLALSAAKTGPRLRGAVPRISEIQALARAGSQNLDRSESTKKLFLKLVDECVAELQHPEALRAAFNDLSQACSRRTSSQRTVFERRDLFTDMLRLAKYDGAHVVSEITDHFDEPRAEFFQRIEAKQEGTELPGARHRSWRERLEDASAVIGIRPEPRHQVVWLFYSPAQLPGWKKDFGQVTMFKASALASILRSDQDVPDFPAELLQVERSSALESFDHPDTVAVRVDLGRSSEGGASKRAKVLAEAFISYGQFSSSTAHWKSTGESRVFEDEELSGWIAGGDFYSEFQDNVIDSISKSEKRLMEAIPTMTAAMEELFDAIRWRQDARNAMPAARILLDVRVVDLIASRVGSASWRHFAKAYLRDSWVRSELGNEIGGLGNIMGKSRIAVDNASRDEMDALLIESRSFPDSGGGNPTIVLQHRRIFQSAPRLLELVRPDTIEHRQVSDVVKWTRNREAAGARLKELEGDWDRYVARLARVRNSLAHGGPLTTASVNSVTGFADRLSAWSIDLALEAVLDKKSIADEFRSYSSAMAKLRSRLVDSAFVEVGLFGVPE